jgi:two-component system sensor histidine kinase MprB
VSLRIRLAAILAVVATLGISTASVAAYRSTSRELHAELDRSLADRTRRTQDELGRPPRAPTPPGRERDAAAPVVQVLDAQGQPRPDYPDSFPLPVVAEDVELASARAGAATRDVRVGDVSYRMRTTALRQGGAIQAARELTETNAVLDALRTRLLLLTFAGGAIAAGLALLVARRIIRPVEQLTATAEHVAATEDLATPIPVDRTDELGRLASAFNAMLEALGTSREEQRRLVDDAGHELRTPLTSLRTNLEVLQQADRLDAADRKRLLADVEAELAELSALVDELVTLSRGAGEEAIIDVRIETVVADAVERCRRRTGREIAVAADPLVVKGRRAQIDRAVTNLLGNAAKFSRRDTPIEVHVTEGRIAVRDHGPGIAAVDRERVFERFYRSESARSTSGSGLGLAIVEQVARSHGGAVFVEDAPGGGAVVGFTLPV